MPYKIYTYADPYNLDKADFWDEISVLPHFCGARTLVNGLKDVLGDNIKGLICTLDALVEHEDVYKQWTDNVSLRVQQYSALTSTFKQLLDKGKIDEKFHMALTQNQNHFLEAIRLFIELDISASSIDRTKGNLEQQLFVYFLNKAQNSKLFRFPSTPSREKLQQIVADLAVSEIKDCRGPQREIKRCERAAELTKIQPLNAIVVHGVHQFSPVQLRLLLAMEKMGITIIFLFNYQKKYSKIYSSWNDIYGCFEVPIHHDTVIPEYRLPTMQNPSNALACAIGELCEDRSAAGSPLLRQWHQLYKSIELIEFANITEYAHFVSNHVEVARKKYAESRGIMERGNDVWDNAGVLRCLEEQVYTANRDIHTLLNIYYPEFSQDRHFLSYPIGQFFSAIYRLWDYEKGCIRFDIPAIKECLSSNILKTAPGEVLLRTFYNTTVLFEHITTFEEFQQEIATDYVQNYERITSSRSTDAIFPLRQLEVYNKYKVSKKDILLLIKAIEEINEIAMYLFEQDRSREDFINFGKHFSNLEEFLKQRELALANEKERELITALQLRLDRIKPEKSNFSGTFRDLKEGLHYYLKQKDKTEQNPDWIVKNFEQIDGDILQSKRQFEREEKKTYHFACLSDRDMNLTVNDQLPWPLTDEFLSTAYLPQDLQFQVYCKTLDRRSEFLRYALFYGLCYNRSNVRLSFVKQYGDETTEPYALLSILGLEAKSGVVEEANPSTPFTVTIRQDLTKGIKYDSFQMMDMYLCPYRYFLDYVMEDSPVIHGNFLFQKYFENLIVEAVWRRIGGKPRAQALEYLDRIIAQESERFEPFFKFWKPTEIYDLRRRARNYLVHDVITDGPGSTVKPYADVHMQMRKQFGAAKFVVDISEVERRNPYDSFESLTHRKYPLKEYSLHRLPKPNYYPQEQQLVDELRNEAKNYINQVNGTDKSAIPSDWCIYCTHRGTCMESFLAGDLSETTVPQNARDRRRSREPQAARTVRGNLPIIEAEGMVPVQDTAVSLSNISSTPVALPAIDAPCVPCDAAEKPITSIAVSETSVVVAQDSPPQKLGDLSVFEEMLRAIQEMVAGNRHDIIALKQELDVRRTRQEDTTRIEALLAEQEKKSQELLGRLAETEGRLASSEEQNRSLSQAVKDQDTLLERKKFLEFTDAELAELQRYTAIVLFDTCSIMNHPDLLNGVREGELVVVPKDVNNELEHHKTRFDDRKIKAQRAITAIFNYKRRYPLIYADALLELVPEVYRANTGEREQNDNKILAVAIRYRRYTDIPVVFITDDRSLSNKAAGEDIDVWTAQDFLAPPPAEEENPGPVQDVSVVAEDPSALAAVEDEAAVMPDPDSEEAIAAEEQRKQAAQAEFLAQKISTKLLHLEASQISVLQNNGVKTVGDFLAQTEESFSRMKAKKGMPFTARYLKEQETLRRKLKNL